MVSGQGERAVSRAKHQAEVGRRKRFLDRATEDGVVLLFTALLTVASCVSFLFGEEEDKEEGWS